MKMNCLIHALTLMLMTIGGAQAQSPSGSVVPVTVENFVRAETDVVPRWTLVVRLYRPLAEILGGKWTFPQAEALN